MPRRLTRYVSLHTHGYVQFEFLIEQVPLELGSSSILSDEQLDGAEPLLGYCVVVRSLLQHRQ